MAPSAACVLLCTEQSLEDQEQVRPAAALCPSPSVSFDGWATPCKKRKALEQDDACSKLRVPQTPRPRTPLTALRMHSNKRRVTP